MDEVNFALYDEWERENKSIHDDLSENRTPVSIFFTLQYVQSLYVQACVPLLHILAHILWVFDPDVSF